MCVPFPSAERVCVLHEKHVYSILAIKERRERTQSQPLHFRVIQCVVCS